MTIELGLEVMVVNRIIERRLRDAQLVLCQVEGWRMQYSRCDNVWRNREGVRYSTSPRILDPQ